MMIQEQLTQINMAITKIEAGAQEYRIGNRSIKRADLGLLYSERKYLEQQLSNNQGYNTTVARFVGR